MFHLILYSILVVTLSEEHLISGHVRDEQGNPLIGASIVYKGHHGTIADERGYFELLVHHFPGDLAVSFVGFKKKTIQLTKPNSKLIISLEPDNPLQEIQVIAESDFIDIVNPIHTETLSEAELQKAPCCNLSESFETNASIDVSFTDAVTGAKQIQMLGLDGIYVQTNRENVPNIRGLNSRFGLSQAPGVWIQTIDFGKGAGSVVNGYESMTGQINLEFKKPETTEKLYTNGFINSLGRYEINANYQFDLLEQNKSKINPSKLNSILMVHYDRLLEEIDQNADSFRDVPQNEQFNIFNKYKFAHKNLTLQAGIHAMHENKLGGQVGFKKHMIPARSTLFGYKNQMDRIELFGKIGVLFPQTPNKGLGFIYSLSNHGMTFQAGRRNYEAKENTLHTNLIYQNLISNTFHKYKIGASLMVNNLQEDYQDRQLDTVFTRQEVVPGIYGEYTFSGVKDLVLVIGWRWDYHNLYGAFITPRVHIKYGLTPKTYLRTSFGTGQRTPNMIADNLPKLVSSRSLLLPDKIRPDRSVNYGFSLSHEQKVLDRPATFTADIFQTDFIDRLITDRDGNPSEIKLTNLENGSSALSFQAGIGYSLTKRISLKTAYKSYRVKAILDGEEQLIPLMAKHRYFLNMGYVTPYDKWKIDATWNWIGAKRLPVSNADRLRYGWNDHSTPFSLISFQISRGYRWGNMFMGGENMLNFKQKSPILSSDDPFGLYFDASMVWGPIVGRILFFGFRYKLEKR